MGIWRHTEAGSAGCWHLHPDRRNRSERLYRCRIHYLYRRRSRQGYRKWQRCRRCDYDEGWYHKGFHQQTGFDWFSGNPGCNAPDSGSEWQRGRRMGIWYRCTLHRSKTDRRRNLYAAWSWCTEWLCICRRCCLYRWYRRQVADGNYAGWHHKGIHQQAGSDHWRRIARCTALLVWCRWSAGWKLGIHRSAALSGRRFDRWCNLPTGRNHRSGWLSDRRRCDLYR